MIFNHWPGLGCQQYSVGFSGDTIVEWESLQFKAYAVLVFCYLIICITGPERSAEWVCHSTTPLYRVQPQNRHTAKSKWAIRLELTSKNRCSDHQNPLEYSFCRMTIHSTVSDEHGGTFRRACVKAVQVCVVN
jgi:hypothetical protein